MSGIIRLVSKTSGEELHIPVGETSLGRGPFLKVTDKRVSRHHALLKLEDLKLTLCPKHKNPCFYKAADEFNFHVLPKDKWKELCHGDCFSLLPDDLVFSVVYSGRDKLSDKDEVDQDESHAAIVSGDILSASQPKMMTTPTSTTKGSVHPPNQTTCPPHKEQSTATASSEVDIGNNTLKKAKSIVKPEPTLTSSHSCSTGKRRTLPGWLSGLTPEDNTNKDAVSPKKRKAPSSRGSLKATTPKSKHDEEDNNGSPPPPKKTAKKVSAAKSANTDDTKTSLEIPTVMDSPGTSSSASSDKVSVCKDDTKKGFVNKPPCPYGASCYRKNPVHFRQFSHDCSSVPAVASIESASSVDEDISDKPICPYGRDCYRKNPVHTQEYRHIDLPAKKMESGKRCSARRTKGKRSVVIGDSDDDGEPNTYDYNDSFINDEDDTGEESSSYGDSEDSDWSPGEGGVKDSSEDIAELVSEAKDFISSNK